MEFANSTPVADMTPADIAAHGVPLAVVAQRKVEVAMAKKQQALRNDHWTAANVWQKEADVWQEVLDILGAQAGADWRAIADDLADAISDATTAPPLDAVDYGTLRAALRRYEEARGS